MSIQRGETLTISRSPEGEPDKVSIIRQVKSPDFDALQLAGDAWDLVREQEVKVLLGRLIKEARRG